MTFEEMEKELAMTNSLEKDVVLNVVKWTIVNKVDRKNRKIN